MLPVKKNIEKYINTQYIHMIYKMFLFILLECDMTHFAQGLRNYNQILAKK